MDARPPVASLFSAFGVPATVTPPSAAAVEATVVWLTPNAVLQPGAEVNRRDGQRILAIRRDEVSSVPIGTRIDAPEIAGGAEIEWRVDGTDLVEQDHIRVFVVRV